MTLTPAQIAQAATYRAIVAPKGNVILRKKIATLCRAALVSIELGKYEVAMMFYRRVLKLTEGVQP